MNKVLIRICEYGNCLGNILIDYGFGVEPLINKCINILYNYNKNLYNVNLPKEIFVVRLFQESNRKGTDAKTPAKILYDSERFIQKEFKGEYYLFSTFTDRKYGRIAIIESDRKRNDEIGYTMSAIIDIGNKTIIFNGLGSVYSVDIYESIFQKSASFLPNFGDIAAEYDEDESRFSLKSLNVLDDFYWILVKNPKGLILPSGKVFVPQM